MKGNKFI